MAEIVTRDLVIAVPAEKFFEVISDYAHYPEFVPSVKGIRVIGSNAPGTKDVEYEVDIGLKKIKYVLRHTEDKPRKNSWTLVSGEMMKISNGSWELSADGNQTRAKYTIEIQISKPALIPQSVVDKITDELTKSQLPKTLDAFKARAERMR
jgi:ribosome-associated toxin RatA of RatAB toxin-antitoxin module